MKSKSILISILMIVTLSIFGQSNFTNSSNLILQGTLFGTVTNCESGNPIQNVTIKASGVQQFVTETDISGYYEMLIEEGIYDVEFILVGYDTVLVFDTTVVAGGMTQVDTCMRQSSYPVSNVVATHDNIGIYCFLEWDIPTGPYEVIYDDGVADDYTIWAQPGGAVAVKFTPVGYPTKAIGGRIYVGDGSFPVGGNFLGSEIAVGVIDDDGTNGLPGTILDSAIITVDNYGWVDYYGLFDVTFEEGDFYLVMWQLGDDLNSAPVGIDTDVPTAYQSYIKIPTNNIWSISPFQDFMIRAYLDGPNEGVLCRDVDRLVFTPEIKEVLKIAPGKYANSIGIRKGKSVEPCLNNNNDQTVLQYYAIGLVSDFEFCNDPTNGIILIIGTTTSNSGGNWIIAGNPPGLYAFAVKAVYDVSDTEWVFSNTFSHLLGNDATFNISLCDSASPEDIEITMTGLTCPKNSYIGVTDINGAAVIDYVTEGYYEIIIDDIGYNVYEIDSIPFFNDTIINIQLTQNMYPPYNLIVDSSANIGIWEEPLDTISNAEVLGYYIYLDGALTDSTAPDQLSYQFTGLINGQSYNACVEAKYACGVSEMVCYSWEPYLVFIKNNRSKSNINIFPNPAKDYITITSATPITNIRITNYVGQEVFRSKLDGLLTQNIVTSNYQTGVYLVEITTSAKVFTKKIIIIS